MEDWARLPAQLQANIQSQLGQVNTTVDAMLSLTSSTDNAPTQKTQLDSQLLQFQQWFRSEVWPFCIRARTREEVDALREELARAEPAAATEQMLEQTQRLREQLTQLEAQRAQYESRLQELAPLVEAQRDVTSASGAADLSREYERQVTDHQTEWKRWLRWLVATVIGAGIVGVGVVLAVHPEEDAGTPEVASAVAIELLVIGLVLYAVRITSLQFRVHRHLEAVARNKAAALATFNRIVSAGTEPEVRSVLAAALAQAVFSSENTGFIDAASDHITLVERLAAPVTQRLTT